MSKKKSKFRERAIEPIDVHDDAEMVRLGIRTPMVGGRDPEVWRKSRKEKRMLPGLRASSGKMKSSGITPLKHVPVRSRMTVYLRKNESFKDTTQTFDCWQHEIDQVLAYYGKPVIKYAFNGKTYEPQERPFWH